jgi:tripartite-type tricarboxylate transporter receptor subunit TctC
VDISTRSVRLLALATLFAVGDIATAQTYPAKRITVIVPFGAGSGTDGVARVVTQRLAEVLKTTIVVENRPGASGAIGTVATARSAPDGYTLMFGGSSTHAANPSLLKSVQYSPKDDFAPIARVGLFPYILVVHPGIEAKSVGELIALAKQKPGTMSVAYSNALGQLAGEMFKRRAGIDIQAGAVQEQSGRHYRRHCRPRVHDVQRCDVYPAPGAVGPASRSCDHYEGSHPTVVRVAHHTRAGARLR